MNMQKILKNFLVFSLFPLSLIACKDKPIINGGEAKSEAYYLQHSEEAKVVAEKCVEFENNSYSAMPPSKQKAWLETVDGINCTNSREAYGTITMNAYQQGLRDAAAKY